MSSIKFGTYTPPEKEKPFGKTPVTIGIFFDGTGNNKTNIEEREKWERGEGSAAFEKYGKDDDDSSYYGERSNVARLWEAYNKNERIYIEGIGTEDKKDDSTTGYGWGSGSTGIRAKVKKGHGAIVEKCKKIAKDKKTKIISTLTIDVYGFSRGAAAARNFVAEITYPSYNPTKKGGGNKTYYANRFNEPVPNKEIPKHGYFGELLEATDLKIDQVNIRFLGIYDTVSSYSPTLSPLPNFNNDVNELKLNDISKVKKLAHFVASDEHRENFSLTHVSGFEKTFPGVHSDIGGGYRDGLEVVEEIETDWTHKSDLYPLRDRLVAEGWYKKEQLYIDGGNLYFALNGKRTIKYTYSFIPLHFMADLSEKTGSKIDLVLIKEDSYSINEDALLVRVKKRLKSYVFEGGRPYIFKKLSSVQGNEIQEQLDLRQLRNEYLHWSSRRKGIGHDPTSDRKREHIY